ncbi:MAG TPA: FTR1 family protein [Burkholderiaceae bacterium]|nr:FTR1 family protein [Burkholderiaceae bacterium]
MKQIHFASTRRAATGLRGLLVLLALVLSSHVAAADDKAQAIVHMLDYISVDYPNFVRDGKILNQSEYEEQLEFAAQSIALLEKLPPLPEQPVLLDRARHLRGSIEAKAAGAEVSAAANALRDNVIRVWALAVAPKQAPDLRVGARLYDANCAACHGTGGRGDGPLAQGMAPPPSDFHNSGRMNTRSIYGLYNTITLGVGGTPMRPFAELSEADRWALAFFVGGIRATPEEIAQGAKLWRQGAGEGNFSDLKKLVTVAPADVRAQQSAAAASVQAYLTAHPEALLSLAPQPLEVTRAKLGQALQAYRQGDRDGARQLAIGAYLEGFELVEAGLNNVDPALRGETERAMMRLRSAIGDGEPSAAVEQQIGQIQGLLDRAEEKLSAGNLSPLAAFISALLILLREGLEALLVLAAILAFVLKTGRRDALPYIHAGWICALGLGGLTWVAANYLLTISGANREVTEGVTALIAAAMLLYVGYWLHSKSYAQAWQHFIRDQVTTALGKRTLWAMAGISFLAIYRELFEIILFYETLWVQVGPEGRIAVLGGIGAAAVLLALLGWLILKYSVRLPIGPFFSATSGLLALMAVVFAGNGMAALQEAGVINSTLVHFVSVPLLGVHPTAQGLWLQLAVLVLVLSGVLLSRRKALRAKGTAQSLQ